MAARPVPHGRSLVLLAAAIAATRADAAHAAVFGGSGVQEGVRAAAGLGGISDTTSIATVVLMVLSAVLAIVLILAVLVIVVAGIYLITSNGDEGQKDKAKKVIFYCVVGIIVIILARALVLFVNGLFDPSACPLRGCGWVSTA